MKKFGFTLAEIVIALSIIGVIAAITLPTVSNSMYQKSFDATEASVVSDLENAFGNMITGEETEDLGTTAWDKAFVNNTPAVSADVLGNYIKMTNSSTNATTFYSQKDFNTATEFNDLTSSSSGLTPYKVIYELKNGALVFVDWSRPSTTIFRHVSIDVNGHKKPNKVGNDIYLFVLDNGGSLYSSDTDKYKNLLRGNQMEKCMNSCLYDRGWDTDTCTDWCSEKF